MKLQQVIKGYKDCRCVRVVMNGRNKCEWNGQGIEHIVERYCPELMNHKVLNVSVNMQGVRIIEVSIEEESEPKYELINTLGKIAMSIMPKFFDGKNSYTKCIDKLDRVSNDLVRVTGIAKKQIGLWLFDKFLVCRG